MKSLVIMIALVCIAVLGTTATAVSESSNARKQKGVVLFNHEVILQGITLKGEYLFVHDDAAMARGEACTRVYKGAYESARKLVVSFHCVPVERARAAHFKVTSRELTPGVFDVREYQFEGDTEAHAVPALK